MPSGSLTADAVIADHYLTADAWIMGGRLQHHRVRDHFGIESDLYVVLSSDIGPYVTFTPIHYVLEDMIARLLQLESSNQMRASITADAWIALSGTYGIGFIAADAVILKAAAGSGSITANAWIVRGGTLTLDAYIVGRITMNAYIVLAT